MRSIAKCDIMFASSGGFISMKTKIIYISGNEVFDMADIRAAFEEVRSTLGLGSDTIMFGVPVDKDDALVSTDTVKTQNVETNVVQETEIIEQEPVIPEQETEILQPEVIEKPTKKTTARKVRARSKEKTDVPETQPAEEKNEEDKKIIPILSILAAQKDSSDSDEEIQDTKSDEPQSLPQFADEKEEVVSDIDISAEFDAPASDEISDQHTAIADMITDEAPGAPIEKTLEQLLESMTPLREDIVEEPIEEEIDSDEDIPVDTTVDDSDATLEQLAAEFAENQDKIPDLPKNENHSKIGKLKNILPFKKAKRDETGLMGDLFGWAGIAANDDDFAIPGFFTNAASKK